MIYENRLVCFFDLLGFSAAIKQAEAEPELLERMSRLFSEFKDGGLESALYGAIPYLDENGPKTLQEHFGDQILEKGDETYKLVATQFSDSFVISAPADNPGACNLLLHAIKIVHLQFFFGIGMLMRGGISLGDMVHERGGALFGPAMIEAYELESKHAVYARVVVSKQASDFISQNLWFSDLNSAFFKGFDGLTSFDLISAMKHHKILKNDKGAVESQLLAVERDILGNTPAAHPKIAYLLDRWSRESHNFSEAESKEQGSGEK